MVLVEEVVLVLGLEDAVVAAAMLVASFADSLFHNAAASLGITTEWMN
jgi:hypothetical protein